MDYIDKWGVSVEEAVRLALIDLKLSRDEVEVKVLEEPSRGFFGIGSKLAKVRVEKIKTAEKAEKTLNVDKSEKPAAEKKDSAVLQKSVEEVRKEVKPQTKEHKSSKKNNKEKKEKKNNKKENLKEKSLNIENVNKEELKEIENHEALTFLKDITEKMGLSLSFKLKAGDDIVYLEMDGKDSGTIIGKRGQTLDAIQYLTSLVVNKDSEKYIKVVIDAENYRAKRQKTLEQLANRLAAKVVKTKKYVRLEPMNPYERKIIHATLQQNPNIITRSEGEEPYRRVIIELKK
ncbi:MAG: RNA-binding cell elongation regulator Jag/EloR [Anaerovoracaceae bacterium]